MGQKGTRSWVEAAKGVEGIVVSPKYPRTFHLPWSPGGTTDDKRMTSVADLIGQEIVITEKCDGSNLAYTRDRIFARSHAVAPGHSSFSYAKATHASIRNQISQGITVFCEYCYAVHSIVYTELPDYSLVFGVRDDLKLAWWSWAMVREQALDLGLPTVPWLFRGTVRSEVELRKLTDGLASEHSALGGIREGVVVRVAREFSDSSFPSYVGKWVRENHVDSDVHWMHKDAVVQRLTRAK